VETKLKSKKFAARDEKYFQNLAREQKSLATPVI
jgi:hypothetical protein